MFFEFIFSLFCIISTIILIFFLYYIFKINDAFFSKWREFQNLSKGYMKEEPKKRKSKINNSRTKEDQHSVEDAEFREIGEGNH